MPAWVAVQSPKTVNLALDVDAGELEAICLAQEIHAKALSALLTHSHLFEAPPA